jgi:cytochrome bd-type quinol oxidase subunit 2
MLHPKRPRIELEKSQTAILLEILTFMLVAGAAGLIGWYYNQLPDKIPIHFNWPSKDENGFGSKDLLWVSPLICGVLAIGLYILNGYPRIFNYPVKITQENAEYQYRQATRMIRILNLIIGLLCLTVTVGSISDGLGYESDFDFYINLLFPVLFIGVPFFFLIKMAVRKKNKTNRNEG